MKNKGSQLQTLSLECGIEGYRMVFLKDNNSFQPISAAYYLLDTMLIYMCILKLNKMYFMHSRNLNYVNDN